jgi:hypothetical protein
MVKLNLILQMLVGLTVTHLRFSFSGFPVRPIRLSCILYSVALVRELYLPSDRRLSAKLVPTFADRGCCVVTATDPHARILDFIDRICHYFFQVAPHLYSRGWVDPVPDPLLHRKSGGAGNRTRVFWICSQELWPLDHRGVRFFYILN